jgi:signal transduction histidine kinase/ActR/RegA family two-component response regulator
MWVVLCVYCVASFLLLGLIHKRVLPRWRKISILLMDVGLLTLIVRCLGASLSFLPALYALIVVGFCLMSGRAIGALALLTSLLAYGGLLFAEFAQWLPPTAYATGASSGQGPFAHLMAFIVIATACGGVYFLLAISIKRIERYADKERRLVEAERQARSHSEKLSVQLEQSKRLEGIGRLAGGVAHEFNNLLTVILGYSRFVNDELAEGSPLREDIREVISSAERAAALTSQLLTFGRKQMFRKRLVSLEAVVSAHAKRLAGELPQGVQLEVSLPTRELSAHVDPSSLDAMLDGLVSNALEAMPRGGKLGLRLDLAVIGAADLWGECAAIEVTDTGIGMDEKVRAHLFEPFFTTKSPADGRGMGLATIYGAARQHGGSVEAESQPGKGSTFRILLPVALDLGLASRSSIPSAPFQAATLLLVEDEELVRRVTARILKKAGYMVHEAANAESALLLGEGETLGIELLVTDIVMPGLSGIELATRLQEKWPALPVLFVSGYTDHSFETPQWTKNAHSAFLAKPFSEDALLYEVATLLGHNTQASS